MLEDGQIQRRAIAARLVSLAILMLFSVTAQLLLTDTGSLIYETLSNRLQRVWRYYLSFQARAEAEFSAPLSSAPCTPAPGRRIIIIRCDNPLSASNIFVSFDRVVPPVTSEQTLRNHISAKADSDEAQPPPKRRWSLLKAVFGGSRSGDGSSSSDDSDANGLDGPTISERDADSRLHPQNGCDEDLPSRTSHQPYTFKFSLEWMDRPQWPSKNKRLFTPCLPVGAQLHVQRRQSAAKVSDYDTASDYESENDTEESRSFDQGEKSMRDEQQQVMDLAPFIIDREKTPTKEDLRAAPLDKLAGSKYAGRALAEWAQVVSECDSFFARRRDEGVPCDRMVETPTLGVESFRK